MPLPKKSEVKNREECISKTYTIEIKHGKSKQVAQAIALSHCNKLFGGIPMKDKKKEVSTLQKIKSLREGIEVELDELYDYSRFLSSLENVINYMMGNKQNGW